MRPRSKGEAEVISAPATDEAHQWDGWGSALKPACEHWILIQKPFKGTYAENVIEHGVGGINIKDCRVEWQGDYNSPTRADGSLNSGGNFGAGIVDQFDNELAKDQGRFPANVITDGSEVVEEAFGDKPGANITGWEGRPSSGYVKGLDSEDPSKQIKNRVRPQNITTAEEIKARGYGKLGVVIEHHSYVDDDVSGARFFFAAKAATNEKNDGLENFYWRKDKDAQVGWVRITKEEWSNLPREERAEGNIHPTVKSLALMSYLITMICPPNETVIDPFLGSGSTVVAANRLKRRFIGCDQQQDYLDIAIARLKAQSEVRVKIKDKKSVSTIVQKKIF